MKNFLVIFTAVFTLVFSASAQPKAKTLRVLQFNIWQEGTVVPGGFEAVADQIIRSRADLVTLSEVRNYHGTKFNERMVAALKKRGQTWYSFYSVDSGILSRFPISESDTIFPNRNDHGSIYKAVLNAYGHEIALYTAHLDYLHAANYLPRGYHSSTWHKLAAPVTDADSVLRDNLASLRDEAIARFLADAKKEEAKKRIVILGGDFNEPSPRDWKKDTENSFDHHGLVIRWQNITALEKAGFTDAYRARFPQVKTHPGFTFPAYNPDVELKKLVWAADADERDRIDFIFFRKTGAIKLQDAFIAGPRKSIVKGRPEDEKTADAFLPLQGVWPTDHKAVLAEFILN